MLLTCHEDLPGPGEKPFLIGRVGVTLALTDAAGVGAGNGRGGSGGGMTCSLPEKRRKPQTIKSRM